MAETNTTDVAERKHAELGPSGAHRWAACPGSVVLCEGRKDNAGFHANWGTAAHELASVILEPFSGEELDAKRIADIEALNAESYQGRVFVVAGDSFEVDLDMATCVNDYIAVLATYLDPGDVLLIEQELPIEHITGEKDATGTGDAVVLKMAAKEIVSADLKSGKGVLVNAAENPQCTMYAEGARFAFEPIYGPFDGWSFRNVIIQPRIGHHDEEPVSQDEHETRVLNLQLASQDVDLARQEWLADTNGDWPSRFLHPDPHACKFCDAKAVCPALRAEVSAGLATTAPASRADDFPDLSLPKQASAALGAAPDASAEALAEALRAANMIEAWLSAVREEGFRRLMDGDDIPGFKLVMGKRGNRAWTDKDQAEAAMKAARLKADEMYSKAIISVTQAEKLLKGKPRVWAKLAGLIGQADGKPSLAPESDERPRYTPQVAEADDFPDLDAGVDAPAEVDPFS